MAWVDHLRLVTLENNRAVVEPLPGHREIAGFAKGENQRKRLGDELMTILGKRVEVVVKEPEGGMSEGGDDGVSGGGGGPAASRPKGMSTTDKRAAMDLPSVRDAVDAFGGDVTPIDFRDEPTATSDDE